MARCIGAAAVFVALATPHPSAAADAPTLDECVKASSDGQARRDEGRYGEARALLRTCASPSCPAIVRQHCEKWRVELEDAMPTVVFAVRRSDGTSVASASVSIDGRLAADRLTGTPVAVDPGEHTFSFRAGTELVELKTLVVAGEKNRVIAVAMASSETPPPPPRTEAAPSRTTTLAPPPPASVGLGILGTAGVATFGVLALTTQADLRDLRRQPCAATKTCPESETDAARRRYLIADVALGVGLVAFAAGAWIWVSSAKAASPSAVMRVVPTRQGSIVSVEASFR